MNIDKEVFVHFGFPKCASTFLQRNFFPKLDNFYFNGNLMNYLMKIMFKPCYDIEEIIKDITLIVNDIKEDNIILSWEGFIGHSSFNYCDFIRNVNLLNNIFPKIKALVIIRRQDDFIESLYNQVQKTGYRSIKLEDFIFDGIFELKKFNILNNFTIDVDNLNYFNFYKNFKYYFNKNVLFIPFELIKTDFNFFIEEIKIFLNYEGELIVQRKIENRKINNFALKLSFYLNKISYAPGNPIGFWPSPYMLLKLKNLYTKKKKYIKIIVLFIIRKLYLMNFYIIISKKKNNKEKNGIFCKIKKNILQKHDISNRKLDHEIKYDLKELGYY